MLYTVQVRLGEATNLTDRADRHPPNALLMPAPSLIQSHHRGPLTDPQYLSGKLIACPRSSPRPS